MKNFNDSKRIQESLLAPYERSTLHWLARRLPAWVTSDHLTIMGLASLFLAGLFYFMSSQYPLLLHGVNLWLAVNWFGDSLDGTLARVRNKQRPRYGYYVDHITDCFGILFLLTGLALSGYMSERVAFAVLIAYFLLSINTYLAAHAMGNFRISFWKFSPTELRILLAGGNLVLLVKPQVILFGSIYNLFDAGGLVAAVLMLAVAVISSIRNTRTLYCLEKV